MTGSEWAWQASEWVWQVDGVQCSSYNRSVVVIIAVCMEVLWIFSRTCSPGPTAPVDGGPLYLCVCVCVRACVCVCVRACVHVC